MPDELHEFDTTLREIMVENDVFDGVLGVARGKGALVERGHGYRDIDRTEHVTPDTLFRLASLSKGFTLAMQQQNVDIIVLFNQRGYDPNYLSLQRELRSVVDQIDAWPE